MHRPFLSTIALHREHRLLWFESPQGEGPLQWGRWGEKGWDQEEMKRLDGFSNDEIKSIISKAISEIAFGKERLTRLSAERVLALFIIADKRGIEIPPAVKKAMTDLGLGFALTEMIKNRHDILQHTEENLDNLMNKFGLPPFRKNGSRKDQK